ncbi:MAG: helix-turn-helix transcriptional regulator [Sphingobium phenoxybenzoativorans]|uniref:LuxR family transcriptional regulator n=1 Tax=Sphingobium phenoxybenzoativorans TaxID=1592790 RepID=A0A975Q2T8_9SPHN|nr:LuxR family transcriptional regulator [Sphingobium phenoxybenzoativorans]QUT07031.1 LuxR family transcriptional regulator [Sphingobium phenoxybenzoativorans]
MEKIFSSLDAVSDVPALWDLLVGFFQRQGITRIVAVHFPPVGSADQDRVRILAFGFPEAWMEDYRAGRHFHDPVRAHAKIHPVAFRWSDIRSLRTITPEEDQFLRDFGKVQKGDGVAIPVFGPYGRNGFIGLSLPAGLKAMPPDMMRLCKLVAQYAHQRYCEIVAPDLDVHQPLSPRELEVLGWVARGKSNSVIAEIIGVSSNTVDTHLRRIYAKLNVTDRVSAALAGLGHGLVNLP